MAQRALLMWMTIECLQLSPGMQSRLRTFGDGTELTKRSEAVAGAHFRMAVLELARHLICCSFRYLADGASGPKTTPSGHCNATGQPSVTKALAAYNSRMRILRK